MRAMTGRMKSQVLSWHWVRPSVCIIFAWQSDGSIPLGITIHLFHFQLPDVPDMYACPDSLFIFHEFTDLCLSLRMRPVTQRDAHEPQSHHSSSDVWPPGCGHQWLDRWHLLHAMAENTESKKRSWKGAIGWWYSELKRGTLFSWCYEFQGSKQLPLQIHIGS